MAKKRGQNEGSMYQRKDGSWAAQVTVGGRRLTKYAKTRKECAEWLKKTLAQVESGLTFQGAQATYQEFLEEWLTTIQSAVRRRTHEQYTQIARQYITPVLGKVRLKDLRPDQIQSLYNARLKDGMSERMVILIHAVIHRSLVHAVKLGLLGRNPADAVTRPKLRRKEMHTLSEDQVRMLLLSVRGTRFEALYQLAVTTGLRIGELLGLKWADLDWKTRTLKIQRQLQRVIPEKKLVFNDPKTEAGRRVIILGPATLEILRRHYQLLQLERQAAGNRWKENNLIFPSTLGTPWEPRNLQRQYSELLEKLGLPHFRFHDLRHTAATLMLQQGIHPKVVQERLGHSEIGMTLNIYSHVLPSMQEEAAAKLDELITPIDVSGELNQLKKQA